MKKKLLSLVGLVIILIILFVIFGNFRNKTKNNDTGTANNADNTVDVKKLCDDSNSSLQKEVDANVDQDTAKEKIVFCGYNDFVGGAGAQFPVFVVDDNGSLIKYDNLHISGEGKPKVGVLDVDKDGIDEILYQSGGCIVATGCSTADVIFSPKNKETYYSTTEEIDFDQHGNELSKPIINKKMSENLKNNSAFQNFLQNNFDTYFKTNAFEI